MQDLSYQPDEYSPLCPLCDQYIFTHEEAEIAQAWDTKFLVHKCCLEDFE